MTTDFEKHQKHKIIKLKSINAHLMDLGLAKKYPKELVQTFSKPEISTHVAHLRFLYKNQKLN